MVSEEKSKKMREAWDRRKAAPGYAESMKAAAEKRHDKIAGAPKSEAHRRATSASLKNKPKSKEHKEALKKVWNQRKADPDAIAEFSRVEHEAHLGKKRGADSIEKQKETMRERPYHHDDEKKRRIGEASAAREHPSYRMNEEGRKKIVAASNDPEVRSRIYATKKQNGSFNTSRVEDRIALQLRGSFPDLKREHVDPRYPFRCDFFIPSLDLFIEYDGTWTHGPAFYDPKNITHQLILKEWKAKADAGSEYFVNAIETWTIRDVEKRRVAEESGISRLVLRTEKDLDRMLSGDYLELGYEGDLHRELSNILRSHGDYKARPVQNRIVGTYQPHIYKREQDSWHKNLSTRLLLVANRQRYLGKTFAELTDRELIRGFRISGMVRGYSYFSPLWARAFIEEVEARHVYDPFGGWGHRLLGCADIPYIYNDLDHRSCDGAESIASEFDLPAKIFYHRDASNFTPSENYDTVFTCPPYHNLELYGDNPETTIIYGAWVNDWWRKVVRHFLKESVVHVGYVMTERFALDLRRVCEEEGLTFVREQPVGSSQGSHLTGGKKMAREMLQIFVVDHD